MITSYSHKNTAARSLASKGFSLVEVLVVVAIIAVLAAVTFPVASNILRSGKLKKNKEIVTGLELAISRFHTEYQYFPAEEDKVYSGDSLTEILIELAGTDNQPVYNIKGINFLEALPEAKSGRSGITRSEGKITGLTNSFGEDVYVKFDLDFDEKIDAPSEFETREVSGVRSLVWTFSDEEDSGGDNNKDAAASWR